MDAKNNQSFISNDISFRLEVLVYFEYYRSNLPIIDN